VKFVVLDEADTMLDMGFIEDVEFILGRTPGKKQMCLFSATMPQRITELAKKYMVEPERILVDLDEPSVDTLDQHYAVVNHNEKFEFLVALLQKERPESAIVFCRTKRGSSQTGSGPPEEGVRSGSTPWRPQPTPEGSLHERVQERAYRRSCSDGHRQQRHRRLSLGETPSEIAAATGVSKTEVERRVDELYREGYITRGNRLTEKGYEALSREESRVVHERVV